MKLASIRLRLFWLFWLWLWVLAAAACGAADPPVRLVDDWPAKGSDDYVEITERWTRRVVMRGTYQEALELAATFKSPEWRAARAEKDADARGLEGEARAQAIAQARAEAAGPYEFQLMVVTWDRRESDLDRGLQVHAEVHVLRSRGRCDVEHCLAIRQEPLPRRAERPEALDDHVHGEPVQPRRKRRLAAEQGELLPRPDEHVLGQLLGCVGAGHPPRQVEDARHMGPVYPLESRRIPLSSKDDVVHRH